MQTAFIMVLTSMFCLFLQSRKRHETGFGLLIFSVMILLNISSIQFGLVANVHFFHICSCMAAITLFDKNKGLRNVIIGLSMLSFFALLGYFYNRPGFAYLPEGVLAGLKIYGYINYVVLFSFTIVFFTSFVKQNSISQEKIMTQNAVLEYKNVQITDSIKYAKHIQDAILPSLNTIKQYLEESFILYKPKDIVAGDFYWMHAKENGQVLFAAADSTGHGVPGAMVSVVCTNALNQAVKEFGLTDPGQILDKTRELVANSFQKSDNDEVKDGMDISLCLIDKDKRVLHWAGANTPLWIIRENSDDVEVIKPDKQSVSTIENPVPYTTHTVQLNPGDCFYLFTDGYADQFGGSAAKKHMQKRIKKLLLTVYRKTMSTQKKLITDNLTHWMENQEQVDDICFIGVKL